MVHASLTSCQASRLISLVLVGTRGTGLQNPMTEVVVTVVVTALVQGEVGVGFLDLTLHHPLTTGQHLTGPGPVVDQGRDLGIESFWIF